VSTELSSLLKFRVTVVASVTVEVEVEVERDSHVREAVRHLIEDHDCPGTGQVGEAIRKAIDKADAEGVCWACKLQGENKVFSVTPVLDGEESKSVN
jgi:hypothetical protein